MKKQEFIALLEGILEADPGTIKGDEAIADLDGWDSLAIVSFIAMVDENFGVAVSPQKITAAKSVSDLIALLGDKITE
jgi:acyl carrier protein